MTSGRINTSMPADLDILLEKPGWLVVNKPADLVCHPTKSDYLSSLIGRLRHYLGPSSSPVMVNRLDRETSGLVMVAKTPEAARVLGRQWEKRLVDKAYLAIVHGHVDGEGLIEVPLGRDERSAVAIKDCVRADGAAASTQFAVLNRFNRAEGPFTLLKVIPHTGRKHQIRLHLAHIGHPVVGDKLYGGEEDAYLALVERRLTDEQRKRLILRCQALHAWQLQVTWEDRRLFLQVEPGPEFLGFLGPGLSEAYLERFVR